MLERLESVKKVGLFKDYTHSPECEFGEITLIYGENGVGKSTIAAILDSLREQNAGEIIRRRSLPGDVAPTVVVTLNGKAYTFNGRDWDDRPPDDTLDVFYPGFVSRNVHAAISVNPEHRRNLCEFVLGRIAVKSLIRLAEADNEARTALADKKGIESKLELLFKKPDTLETFLGLSNHPSIDEELEKARVELKQAQSREAILTRAIPAPIALLVIDRDAIDGLLDKSADDIDVNVAGMIQDHVSKHLDVNGENWLAYGAKHIESNNRCPFCAQDTTKSNVVTAIRSYFSTEYRNYTSSLLAEIQNIRSRFDLAAFSRICASLTSQVEVAAQWADEMVIDRVTISTTLAEAEAAWKRGVKKLEKLFADKQAKPLDKMDRIMANAALAEYQHAIDILAGVNDVLCASGKKAEARKTALSKTDVARIEERIRRLDNQKVRFEPLAQNLLAERNGLIEMRSKLESEKMVLKNAIDDHAAKVVSKYQDGINRYLAYFGCDMQIESIEPKFPSGKASVQYRIEAHGHEIPLGFSKDRPCFETVLSDGDKNTLALSFFFARLKDHDNLTGRVIVLDDPVNSLGSSRRGLIEKVIRDLRVRGAQVVVLTHDERLAAMMWRDPTLMKDKGIVALQVERTGSGSRLKSWDMERATQSEYVRNYLVLVDFFENSGDHKKAAGSIRPYVEQRLRHLYPGPPFLTRDSLGKMIDKIQKSIPGSRTHELQSRLDELDSINAASLPSHHATDDVPGMSPLSPEEVRLYVQKALKVLG